PHRKVVLEGREIFQQVCAACHGADGKGVSIAGSEIPAPSFVHSARIKNKKSLINILLHGLTGPIDGKTYPDVMAPFGAANSDQWVASVVSYMQHQFKDRDQKIEPVKPEEVKSLRAANANRNKPWTIQELEGSSPNGPSVDKPVAGKSAERKSVASKSTESKSVGKSAVSKPAKKSLTGPTGKGSSVPSSGSIKNSKEVA